MDEPQTKFAVFPFGAGVVQVSFPERLSGDEVDDLEAYFALLIKRLRSSSTPPEQPTPAVPVADYEQKPARSVEDAEHLK